jgi:hypothetical protein
MMTYEHEYDASDALNVQIDGNNITEQHDLGAGTS